MTTLGIFCYTLIMKQIIGWIGVGLIVSAYTLNVFGLLRASDLTYCILNLLGAIGIIVSSYAKRDFQPIILNSIWVIVAIVGIIRSAT